jgi:adenylate cyclase class IV
MELKALVPDLEPIRAKASVLADGPAVVIHQHDTFYHTRAGRLKLRRGSSSDGTELIELIAYDRRDEAGVRVSSYQRLVPAGQRANGASTPDAGGLTASLLASALGVRGDVIKRRTLFLIGQTRVHLDEVADLGDFVELEVVLKPDQSEGFGRKVADELLLELGIDPSWIKADAYIDLLERRETDGQ